MKGEETPSFDFVQPDDLLAAWESTHEGAATRYPVYIPSLGRAETAKTPDLLPQARLVVERAEHAAYVARFGAERVLAMPGDNYGAPSFVRNWIKDHARAEGHARHWQVDDNVQGKIRRHTVENGKHTYVGLPASAALSRVEDFVDLFTNIAAAGLKAQAFSTTMDRPLYLNQQVYSCTLMAENDIRWRDGVAGDTDYSLQVLARGLCTLLVAAYTMQKAKSGAMAGGNTGNIYSGDGRLRNITNLQRYWPTLGIGTTERFGKTVAQTGHIWRRFRQQPEPRF